MAATACKALLVDDSWQTRLALKNALREVFSGFLEAEDGLEAIKVFVEEKPGFIITAIELPSIDGLRFISTVRNMDDGRDVPIIMISGAGNSLKKKLAGFNLGASDFMPKPFESEELEARVRSLLRVKALMEELKEKNALLERLAVIDELTGLYNRRHFFTVVKDQLALGFRHNFKFACLLIDIDHFKKINDTWGHMAGDDILRKVGGLLDSCKREGELLARFGGEEFILCLFNTDRDSAISAAERFRELVRSGEFSADFYPALRVTISVGVAIQARGCNVTIDELIKTADQALYRSKTDGRDRVSVSECIPGGDPPPIDVEMSRRNDL